MTFSKTIQFETRPLYFYALLVIIFMLGIFYAYFVNQAVVNIVERQGIEGLLLSKNSSISELELEYISQRNNLSLARAYEMGFVEVNTPRYVSRVSNAQSLTFSDNVQ